MTINQDEYKSTIGLDSLYVAELIGDSASSYSADTPAYLAPAAEASATPSVNQETQYADDAPFDVLHAEGDTIITMRVTGMPPEMLAAITGNAFDATTGRFYDYGAQPPEYALGFRSLKSNGSYRYYWYLKGRFTVPPEQFQTKGESPAPQTIELTYTAIKTVYAFDVGLATNQQTKRVWGDSDTDNFSGSTWFSQVQVPNVGTPSALALSSSDPADDETGVGVTENISLVFNNALASNAENGCVLLDDGVVVAVTKSISADRKTVTLNPDASLDAATTYDVAIGVKDIYGDTLDTAIDFTTA